MTHRSRHVCFSSFVMFAAWAGATWVESRPAVTLAKPLQTINSRIEGWIGTDDPPLTESVLESLRPSAYLSRTYQKAGERVNLFIAYYALTRAGESMHSPKNCLPGGGWQILYSGFAEVKAGPAHFPVNKYIVQKDGQRELVLYWYQSKERIVASEYAGKLFRAWDAMRTGDTSGSIVRITLAEGPDAFQRARLFAARIRPQVQQLMVQ